MGSSTVDAQKLANEANIQMTRETNEMNQAIAREANEYNRQNLEMQNTWNREQIADERAYNDPSKQVERYLKAGINPLWAMTGADPGNSQHLESGQPAPAEVPTMQAAHVQPEYDPFLGQKIGAISGALNTVMNGAQGFAKLALESKDVETRRMSQISSSSLQAAQSAFTRSQTVSQDLFNNLNQTTYLSQVESKRLQVDLLRGEIAKGSSDKALIDAKVNNEKELNSQIVAQTDFIKAQTDSFVEAIKIAWRQLAINQQNADTAEYSAHSTSYYEGQKLQQSERFFNFSKEKQIAELEHMSISQIMDFYLNRRGKLEEFVGSSGYFLDSFSSGTDANVISDNFDALLSVGKVLRDRVAKEPWNNEALQSFDEWQKGMNSLPLPPVSTGTPLQGFSVLNPPSF